MKLYDFTNGKRGPQVGIIQYDYAGAVRIGEDVGQFQRVRALCRKSYGAGEPVAPITFDVEAVCFCAYGANGWQWYYLADDVKAVALQADSR